MSDWRPAPRDAQIHLAAPWLSAFQTKAQARGLPPAAVTDMTAALSAAREIPAAAKRRAPSAIS